MQRFREEIWSPKQLSTPVPVQSHPRKVRYRTDFPFAAAALNATGRGTGRDCSSTERPLRGASSAAARRVAGADGGGEGMPFLGATLFKPAKRVAAVAGGAAPRGGSGAKPIRSTVLAVN